MAVVVTVQAGTRHWTAFERGTESTGIAVNGMQFACSPRQVPQRMAFPSRRLLPNLLGLPRRHWSAAMCTQVLGALARILHACVPMSQGGGVLCYMGASLRVSVVPRHVNIARSTKERSWTQAQCEPPARDPCYSLSDMPSASSPSFFLSRSLLLASRPVTRLGVPALRLRGRQPLALPILAETPCTW